MTFQPQFMTHEPVFGKQIHGHGSPYWMFQMELPPVNEKIRGMIDVFRAKANGTSIVEFYDVRRPVPLFYSEVNRSMQERLIPDLKVKSVSKSGSSLVVKGDDGDVISVGDPLAFTHAGVRYYFKAEEMLALDGTDQTLPVIIRPRKDLTLSNTFADRVKPRCRFMCDFNNMGGNTSAHGFTKFTLTGVEYSGVV